MTPVIHIQLNASFLIMMAYTASVEVARMVGVYGGRSVIFVEVGGL
jgi:hypothetical protein